MRGVRRAKTGGLGSDERCVTGGALAVNSCALQHGGVFVGLVWLVACTVFLAVGHRSTPRPPALRSIAVAAWLAALVALPFLPTLWRTLHMSASVASATSGLWVAPVCTASGIVALFSLQSVRLPRAIRDCVTGTPPANVIAEIAAVGAHCSHALHPVAVRSMQLTGS